MLGKGVSFSANMPCLASYCVGTKDVPMLLSAGHQLASRVFVKNMGDTPNFAARKDALTLLTKPGGVISTEQRKQALQVNANTQDVQNMLKEGESALPMAPRTSVVSFQAAVAG